MHTSENTIKATATKKVGDDISEIIASEPSACRGKRHSEEDYRTALSDMTNKQDRPKKRKTKSQSQSQKKKEGECVQKPTPAVPAPAAVDMDTEEEWESIPHDNIDFGDDTDPQFCTTYVEDIYAYLRENQVRYQSKDYMTSQSDITIAMRGILIDWLVEVSEEYSLSSETLYLAISYVDRYLSRRLVNRNKLQLVGVACILIAAKYEEIYAPSVEDMVFIADNTYTKEEVFAMETSVLDVLEFCLSGVTARTFLKRFLKAAKIGSEPSVHMFASYLCELSLLHYDCLKFLPSVIAASATALTMITLRKSPIWTSTLEYYTRHRITDPEIRDCIRVLHHLHQQAPSGNLQAVQEKYMNLNLYYVSDHNVVPPAQILPFYE